MSKDEILDAFIEASINEAVDACAAGPWVKIEPGCEMPNNDDDHWIRHSGGYGIGFLDHGMWRHTGFGDEVVGLTHYAPINPPEES